MKTELKELELKYNCIVNSENAGIIIVADQEGHIIEWNSTAELAFGYVVSEIIGMPLTVLIDVKRKKSALKNLLKAINNLNGQTSSEIVEICGLKKCGTKFPLEFELRKWETTSGAKYSAVMIDISKRKLLEMRLSEKSRELDLFLYRSAHDLKGPLCSAEGLINLILEEDVNPAVTGLIHMVKSSLKRGKQLLDDLTLMSIISEGNREISEIYFEELKIEIITSLMASVDFELVNFEYHSNYDGPFVGNRNLVVSIVENLVHYALKHGNYDCDSQDPFICLNFEKHDFGVQITVSYLGTEFGTESIDKIFDLEPRISDQSVSCVGLGIYIVKNIVEILKGEINLKFEFNNITHIEVILPNIKIK
jgi:PAS domain S-box-containing protein